MNDLVYLISSLLLFSSVFLSLYRMIKGPTTMDRVLSFDSFAISVVGIMVLLYIHWKTVIYLDLIIIFSLFGFFGTVAFSYFLDRTYPENTEENNS